ncbi:MAG TPA: transglutaminase-like domain-containing protein [Solirubrobacteraceae bacterium]|nr:transglutaminase-like domain-containing protein [Solirubrobacteraceae bacterium]
MSSVAADLAAPAREPAGAEKLGLRLLAFFGLAAFAAVRYSALIARPPAGRAVLVAACVTAGCGLLAASGRIGGARPAGTLLRAGIVAGTFALSLLALHVPAHLLAPDEWRHLANRLSGGVGEISGWLWPYRGEDRWAQTAVLLPVPAVLLAAGCAWFWPSQAMIAGRRAFALGALLAIFVTGTANAPASVPAFDGIVLMGLVAAALLLPLTAASETGRALCWVAACAAAAVAVQAALRPAGPWIHYREPSAVAATTANTRAGVSFQWAELYGPNHVPRSQAPMLIVSESHPELLRLTSLDRFDGLRFLRGDEPPGSARLDIPTAGLHRWTDRAIVEVRGLRSSLLASGGGLPTLIRPFLDLEPIPTREPDGTAATPGVTQSGASYEVLSYDPHPSASAARRAPRTFPRAYLPYAQFELPAAGASALVPPDLEAEASESPPAERLVGPSAPGRTPASDPKTAALIEASPYGPMFALARSLAAGASSDYDVAERIERYLQSSYAYDLSVPLTRYPLEAFLFSQRRGYCQEFSGAMALMLRMDGVPARIGVGFLPSARGPGAGTWQIRASDAHAWVEVFFSGIGWVSFDPTPPVSAAASQAENTAVSRATVFGIGAATHRHDAPSSRAGGHGHGSRGGGSGWLVTALVLVLGGLLALGASAWAFRRRRSRRARRGEGDPALAELREALVRLGSSEPGLTLAQLERRLARQGDTQAAAYVGAIRTRRFGPRPGPGGPRAGRSQLRRALAPSHGIAGRARALAALPPAWATGRR